MDSWHNKTIQRLDLSFPIHAEDGGVLGWVQVEADDAGALVSKSGSLEAM